MSAFRGAVCWERQWVVHRALGILDDAEVVAA